MMAKACHYAQQHIDCSDAWPTDPIERETLLQCTSYQMACFLAQNTRDGHGGVEWAVLLEPLCEYPAKSEDEWERIIAGAVEELGGWKTDSALDDPDVVTRCLAACRNSGGEPDFFLITVHCSDTQFTSGRHYEAVREAADAAGYRGVEWVADDEDPALRLLQLPESMWDYADTIDMSALA